MASLRRAMRPIRRRFVIHRSRIHGRGAFASEPIRAGIRLAEYVGEVITGAEADRRCADDPDQAPTYFFAVDRDRIIDGASHGSDARYINHSCAPNCKAWVVGVRVFIYALRQIHPGEELTYDYGLWFEGPFRADWLRQSACRCGAPRCRGTLVRLRAENRVGREYQRWLRSRRST